MNNIKYIREKPSNLEPVERVFTIKPNDNNSFDWIQFTNGWRVEKQRDGWALFSPTYRKMGIFGYLELS